ncbi:MAG: pentapeptide repeat-containing protein, partial [Bdellovibrionota bacterium]
TFNECTLAHADLRWANLEGAAFVKSNLSKVNFCNSNMTNVKFMKCNLKGATYNIHTVLPFNQEHASGLGMVFVH